MINIICIPQEDEIEELPVDKKNEKDTDSIQSIPIQTTDDNKKSTNVKETNKPTKNSDRDSDSSIEISGKLHFCCVHSKIGNGFF